MNVMTHECSVDGSIDECAKQINGLDYYTRRMQMQGGLKGIWTSEFKINNVLNMLANEDKIEIRPSIAHFSQRLMETRSVEYVLLATEI